MLLIDCPWCGSRNEDEFVNGGESDKRRPSSTDSDEWYNYIFVPTNSSGWLRERWWHVRGCRRWFKIERNTRTHELRPVPKREQWL